VNTVVHDEEEVMNNQKKLMILATMLAFLIILPVARASQEDQATKLTFTKDVQIPGRVLPAGTYWFILADNNVTPNIVQIFNLDRTMLYATILTINTERSNPTDDTSITFANRGSMQPETIVSWFYPGDESGHEFVYSNQEERELGQVKHHTVMAAARVKQQIQSTPTGD
jgi:DNA-binding beta-propeller fold protein YncE